MTSCLPSPSRAPRIEQTRPAACPATGWLRPRSWRSPRQLGVTRTRTLRPNALPSPESPGPLSGPTTSPKLLRLVPSGDTAQSDQTHSVLQRQRNPLPWDPRSPEKVAGKKKSLVYWATEASAGIRFPISAVSFQQIPGAGGERVDPPGRDWGCGSRESEFAERSLDCGRGQTRNQQQRGQERTDHRDHIKHCTSGNKIEKAN